MNEPAVMPTYARYPLTLVRGAATQVWDDEGRAYLDFAGALGVNALGHSHPAWVAAVRDQLGTLDMVSNLFATQPQAELAARLASLMPVSDARVFFCNSGAEANEAAIKLARKHGLANGRPTIVALEGSFHGRTTAALAATGQPGKRAAFEPLVNWCRFVTPGDLEVLDAALAPGDVGAVMLEPVMGEGDVLTLAKALGGGLPIGAMLARDAISFEPGDHASTFGGGPVVCAGALAVLDTIERDGLLERARAIGDALPAQAVAAAPEGTVIEARGRGCLWGFQLARPVANDVVLAMIGEGVLATTAGPDVVRMSPPLTSDDEEVSRAARAFGAAVVTVLAPLSEGSA